MYSLLVLGALAVQAIAVPSSSHVIHEKRDYIPSGWSRYENGIEEGKLIPLRFALTQSNLDKLDDYLMEVSHPESKKYGQHWTQEEIKDMFAPSEESHSTVREWLKASGIDNRRIKVAPSKQWLHVDATVEEAEDLLKTKYYFYEHDTGAPHIGCEQYHLPKHVSQHVDFVTPTLHFDTRHSGTEPEMKRKRDMEKRDIQGLPISGPNNGFAPKLGQTFNNATNVTNLACSVAITPGCLRALYGMPILTQSAQDNGFGIVEYSPQAYLQSDLLEFFAAFNPVQTHVTPNLNSVDGGYAQTTNVSFDYNGESDLDLEYGMTLVDPVAVTLFQVGDPYASGSFNTFLDAIDGSYCTYQGGDDPSQDPQYPDTANAGMTGAYEGLKNCGVYKPTSVLSTSYGYNEHDLTPKYEQRQCNEYAKLGLQGVSIMYSSGDYGVAGNGGQCIDPKTGAYNNGTSGKFNPSFPGGCPYVTSVGATQVVTGASVTQPESACETVIYSGGGFSNVFPMPSYQSAAVQYYYKYYSPPYGADRYNNSMKVRGFPDVSANGANYVIFLDGVPITIYGTSASSPTFASVVTIINEKRAEAGKKPVGFLNPTLYANPRVMNDIEQGGNQGCGTPGFTAVPGWDPVTGLGTPNTPAMIKLFLSMP